MGGSGQNGHAVMLGNDFITARNVAWRVVLWQAGATLLAAAVFYLLSGAWHSASALAGGAIGTVSSLIVAVLVFGNGKAKSASSIARGLYAGKAFSFVLAVFGFVVFLGIMKMSPLPLLAGYIATVLMYWVALFATARG